jgi:hypothetical protein
LGPGGLPHRNIGRQLNTVGAGATSSSASPLRLAERILAILLALALFGLLLIPPGKAIRRRIPLWRAKEPGKRAIASFALFEASAADLGAGRGPGETPFAYSRRLGESFQEFPTENADRLARATVEALYSPRPVLAKEGEIAKEDAATAAGFLKKNASMGRRIAGAYRLERFSSPSSLPASHR